MIMIINPTILSILILLIGEQPIELAMQLVNLFIDIPDILPVALVLPFLILLLVGLLVLRAELVIDLAFFFALLFDEELFDGRDSAWNGFFVLQDAV